MAYGFFKSYHYAMDGPVNAIPHTGHLFKDNNGNFSPIIWDLNGSLWYFQKRITSQPVTTSRSAGIGHIFHGSANNQNKSDYSNVFFRSYKRMYVAHMRTILNETICKWEWFNKSQSITGNR